MKGRATFASFNFSFAKKKKSKPVTKSQPCTQPEWKFFMENFIGQHLYMCCCCKKSVIMSTQQSYIGKTFASIKDEKNHKTIIEFVSRCNEHDTNGSAFVTSRSLLLEEWKLHYLLGNHNSFLSFLPSTNSCFLYILLLFAACCLLLANQHKERKKGHFTSQH